MEKLESRFIELVSHRLGLRIREQDQTIFWRKMMARVRAVRLSSLEEYYRFLVEGNSSALQEAEWQEVASLLTVTESYFFRDQGQFSLLKNHILPELISRRASTLRIWSAGCSTGEEALSLAILIAELTSTSQIASILILGSDVNISAVERAKRGIYSDWSFRCVDPVLKQKYFRRHRDGWEIDPKIRRMVTFQLGNLIQDNFPHYGTELHDVDLILCRNVFIYFDEQAIALVLNKFYNTLAPGGYLITGHTELYGQNTAPLRLKNFPESVVYQRSLATEYPLRVDSSSDLSKNLSSNLSGNLLGNLLGNLSDHSSSPSSSNPSKSVIHSASNSQNIVSQRISNQPVSSSESQAIFHLVEKAEASANSGLYTSAIQFCRQALQLDPLSTAPYYLLAQVAEEQGDIEEAKGFLKRIIYLSPNSVEAYFELGCLHEKEGSWAKAQKVWKQALNLLEQVPDRIENDGCKKLTPAELKLHLERKTQTNPNTAFLSTNSAD